MRLDDTRKQKNHPQQKNGLRRTLEGVLEKLREGMDELADLLRPQPVPIPIPVERLRRR